MRKVILLSLAAIMLLSGTLMATEARIMALGGYTAPYICDDANVYKWYATLPSYSNLLIANMWNFDYYYEEPDAAFAMTYALGEEGKYGTLAMGFMRETWGLNENYGLVYDIFDSWDDYEAAYWTLESKYIAMYGFQMDKMSFGLYFSRASERYTEEYDEDGEDDYEYETLAAYTTIGLGFRMDLGDNMTLDLAGDYTKATDERTYTLDEEGDWELDPGKMMSVRARMFYEWNDEITFVPYVSYKSRDFGYVPVEEWYTDEGYGYKDMEMTFGIGANMTVNEDNMILFAIEPWSMLKAEPSGYTDDYEYTWEVKYRVMPRFILALESDLTDWLTFRTGCSKDLGKASFKVEYDGDGSYTYEQAWTDEFYWDAFSWNLGLGFHFGDFDIDCVINKTVPFKMGYWLTGMQQGYYEYYNSTPISMISAKYHF